MLFDFASAAVRDEPRGHPRAFLRTGFPDLLDAVTRRNFLRVLFQRSRETI